jgi:hypothetical protein
MFKELSLRLNQMTVLLQVPSVKRRGMRIAPRDSGRWTARFIGLTTTAVSLRRPLPGHQASFRGSYIPTVAALAAASLGRLWSNATIL